MTQEKIIELAAQFDDNSPEFAMSTEAVIAFARALIEARLSGDGDEPVAWMEFDGEGGYDFYAYRGNESFQKEFLEGNPSSTYRDWVQPLYRRPQSKARLTDEEVIRLETELAELIEKVEAVIEAAERHGNVGYADGQMVYLQAAVERVKEKAK